MKNKTIFALTIVFIAGCGGASVGIGFDTGDPWRMRPEIPRDPPKPDWMMEMERQYRADIDKQVGQN